MMGDATAGLCGTGEDSVSAMGSRETEKVEAVAVCGIEGDWDGSVTVCTGMSSTECLRAWGWVAGTGRSEAVLGVRASGEEMRGEDGTGVFR